VEVQLSRFSSSSSAKMLAEAGGIGLFFQSRMVESEFLLEKRIKNNGNQNESFTYHRHQMPISDLE
jgi:hypothetical protein